MPESPEVQVLVEFLDERIQGHTITDLDIIEFRIVKTRDRPPSSLIGAGVSGVRRFGKHLGLETSAGWLMIGFGRNGWIRWHPPGEQPDDTPVPEVARITLDDGAMIRLVDTGSFLAVTAAVVDAPAEASGIAALGPDPLDPGFSRDDVDRALGTRRKQIKALLQEQASFAGIGNAYSDEILHRARLSPTDHAVLLDEDDRDRLFRAVLDVMRHAVDERRGVLPSRLKEAKVEAMLVHGRGGQPCPVCGTTIEDRSFGAASAQFCPHCQQTLTDAVGGSVEP